MFNRLKNRVLTVVGPDLPALPSSGGGGGSSSSSGHHGHSRDGDHGGKGKLAKRKGCTTFRGKIHFVEFQLEG